MYWALFQVSQILHYTYIYIYIYIYIQQDNFSSTSKHRIKFIIERTIDKNTENYQRKDVTFKKHHWIIRNRIKMQTNWQPEHKNTHQM